VKVRRKVYNKLNKKEGKEGKRECKKGVKRESDASVSREGKRH
jgi:hypothetical protein